MPGGSRFTRHSRRCAMATSVALSGSGASIVMVQPGSERTAAAGSPNVCIGWKPPVTAPPRAAASSADTSVTPLQCTAKTSRRQRALAAVAAIASSGVVTNTRSQPSTTCCALGSTAQPSMDAASFCASAATMLVTAKTRSSRCAKLHASAVPRRPAPTNPMRSAASSCGVIVVVLGDRSVSRRPGAVTVERYGVRCGAEAVALGYRHAAVGNRQQRAHDKLTSGVRMAVEFEQARAACSRQHVQRGEQRYPAAEVVRAVALAGADCRPCDARVAADATPLGDVGLDHAQHAIGNRILKLAPLQVLAAGERNWRCVGKPAPLFDRCVDAYRFLEPLDVDRCGIARERHRGLDSKRLVRVAGKHGVGAERLAHGAQVAKVA